jgi:hypothetical protein
MHHPVFQGIVYLVDNQCHDVPCRYCPQYTHESKAGSWREEWSSFSCCRLPCCASEGCVQILTRFLCNEFIKSHHICTSPGVLCNVPPGIKETSVTPTISDSDSIHLGKLGKQRPHSRRIKLNMDSLSHQTGPDHAKKLTGISTCALAYSSEAGILKCHPQYY